MDEITKAQHFMQEILLNTVQYRNGPYLSKYQSKTDNETRYTNIYLHFSTFAQVLSEPFLLADMLYNCKEMNKNFDINHDDVKKMLKITEQYMPNLHRKIQTSIENQKYINGFMQACGYKQDDSISHFLMWIPQNIPNITYDIFKKAFDEYVADIENPKPQQQINDQNNIHMNNIIPNNVIDNMVMNINNNNQFMSNNMGNNMTNKMVNSNIEMNNQIIMNNNMNNMNNYVLPSSISIENNNVPQTNERQTNTYIVDNTNTDNQSQEAQFSLCGFLNKYIGYDDNGCHCCCLW